MPRKRLESDEPATTSTFIPDSDPEREEGPLSYQEGVESSAPSSLLSFSMDPVQPPTDPSNIASTSQPPAPRPQNSQQHSPPRSPPPPAKRQARQEQKQQKKEQHKQRTDKALDSVWNSFLGYPSRAIFSPLIAAASNTARGRSKYSPLSYTRSDTTASNPDKEGIVGGGLPPSAWVQRANSLKEAYEQRMQERSQEQQAPPDPFAAAELAGTETLWTSMEQHSPLQHTLNEQHKPPVVRADAVTQADAERGSLGAQQLRSEATQQGGEVKEEQEGRLQQPADEGQQQLSGQEQQSTEQQGGSATGSTDKPEPQQLSGQEQPQEEQQQDQTGSQEENTQPQPDAPVSERGSAASKASKAYAAPQQRSTAGLWARAAVAAAAAAVKDKEKEEATAQPQRSTAGLWSRAAVAAASAAAAAVKEKEKEQAAAAAAIPQRRSTTALWSKAAAAAAAAGKEKEKATAAAEPEPQQKEEAASLPNTDDNADKDDSNKDNSTCLPTLPRRLISPLSPSASHSAPLPSPHKPPQQPNNQSTISPTNQGTLAFEWPPASPEIAAAAASWLPGLPASATALAGSPSPVRSRQPSPLAFAQAQHAMSAVAGQNTTSSLFQHVVVGQQSHLPRTLVVHQDQEHAEGAWPPIQISMQVAQRSASNSPLRGFSALDVQGQSVRSGSTARRKLQLQQHSSPTGKKQVPDPGDTSTAKLQLLLQQPWQQQQQQQIQQQGSSPNGGGGVVLGVPVLGWSPSKGGNHSPLIAKQHQLQQPGEQQTGSYLKQQQGAMQESSEHQQGAIQESSEQQPSLEQQPSEQSEWFEGQLKEQQSSAQSKQRSEQLQGAEDTQQAQRTSGAADDAEGEGQQQVLPDRPQGQQSQEQLQHAQQQQQPPEQPDLGPLMAHTLPTPSLPHAPIRLWGARPIPPPSPSDLIPSLLPVPTTIQAPAIRSNHTPNLTIPPNVLASLAPAPQPTPTSDQVPLKTSTLFKDDTQQAPQAERATVDAGTSPVRSPVRSEAGAGKEWEGVTRGTQEMGAEREQDGQSSPCSTSTSASDSSWFARGRAPLRDLEANLPRKQRGGQIKPPVRSLKDPSNAGRGIRLIRPQPFGTQDNTLTPSAAPLDTYQTPGSTPTTETESHQQQQQQGGGGHTIAHTQQQQQPRADKPRMLMTSVRTLNPLRPLSGAGAPVMQLSRPGGYGGGIKSRAEGELGLHPSSAFPAQQPTTTSRPFVRLGGASAEQGGGSPVKATGPAGIRLMRGAGAMVWGAEQEQEQWRDQGQWQEQGQMGKPRSAGARMQGGPSLGNTAGQNTASRTHQLLGSLHNKVRQDAERHAVGIIPDEMAAVHVIPYPGELTAGRRFEDPHSQPQPHGLLFGRTHQQQHPPATAVAPPQQSPAYAIDDPCSWPSLIETTPETLHLVSQAVTRPHRPRHPEQCDYMQLAGMVPQLVLDYRRDAFPSERIPAAPDAKGMGLHATASNNNQYQQQRTDLPSCAFTAHLPPGFNAWSSLDLLPGTLPPTHGWTPQMPSINTPDESNNYPLEVPNSNTANANSRPQMPNSNTANASSQPPPSQHNQRTTDQPLQGGSSSVVASTSAVVAADTVVATADTAPTPTHPSTAPPSIPSPNTASAPTAHNCESPALATPAAQSSQSPDSNTPGYDQQASTTPTPAAAAAAHSSESSDPTPAHNQQTTTAPTTEPTTSSTEEAVPGIDAPAAPPPSTTDKEATSEASHTVAGVSQTAGAVHVGGRPAPPLPPLNPLNRPPGSPARPPSKLVTAAARPSVPLSASSQPAAADASATATVPGQSSATTAAESPSANAVTVSQSPSSEAKSQQQQEEQQSGAQAEGQQQHAAGTQGQQAAGTQEDDQALAALILQHSQELAARLIAQMQPGSLGREAAAKQDKSEGDSKQTGVSGAGEKQEEERLLAESIAARLSAQMQPGSSGGETAAATAQLIRSSPYAVMDEILHSHVIEERAQQTAQAWKEARAAQVEAARAAARAAGEARCKELQERQQQHQQQGGGRSVVEQQDAQPEQQDAQQMQGGSGENKQQGEEQGLIREGADQPEQQQTQEQQHTSEAALRRVALAATQSMQPLDLGTHAALSRDLAAPIQIFCTNLTLPPAPATGAVDSNTAVDNSTVVDSSTAPPAPSHQAPPHPQAEQAQDLSTQTEGLYSNSSTQTSLPSPAPERKQQHPSQGTEQPNTSSAAPSQPHMPHPTTPPSVQQDVTSSLQQQQQQQQQSQQQQSQQQLLQAPRVPLPPQAPVHFDHRDASSSVQQQQRAVPQQVQMMHVPPPQQQLSMCAPQALSQQQQQQMLIPPRQQQQQSMFVPQQPHTTQLPPPQQQWQSLPQQVQQSVLAPQQPTSEQLAQELAALILQACQEDSSLTDLLHQQPQTATSQTSHLPRSVQLSTNHHPTLPSTAAHKQTAAHGQAQPTSQQPGTAADSASNPALVHPPRPAYLAGSGLPPRALPPIPILPVGPGGAPAFLHVVERHQPRTGPSLLPSDLAPKHGQRRPEFLQVVDVTPLYPPAPPLHALPPPLHQQLPSNHDDDRVNAVRAAAQQRIQRIQQQRERQQWLQQRQYQLKQEEQLEHHLEQWEKQQQQQHTPNQSIHPLTLQVAACLPPATRPGTPATSVPSTPLAPVRAGTRETMAQTGYQQPAVAQQHQAPSSPLPMLPAMQATAGKENRSAATQGTAGNDVLKRGQGVQSGGDLRDKQWEVNRRAIEEAAVRAEVAKQAKQRSAVRAAELRNAHREAELKDLLKTLADVDAIASGLEGESADTKRYMQDMQETGHKQISQQYDELMAEARKMTAEVDALLQDSEVEAL